MTIDKYREWARQARERAASITDPDIQRQWLNLAKQYERLALTMTEALETARQALATGEAITHSRELLGRVSAPMKGRKMDRALIIKHLRQAERHIAEGEEHIRHQLNIIAKLDRDGHDSNLARELLETLEKTQALHVDQRDYMIRELAAYDASEVHRDQLVETDQGKSKG